MLGGELQNEGKLWVLMMIEGKTLQMERSSQRETKLSKWPQNVSLPPPNLRGPGVFLSLPAETRLSECQAPD